VVELRFVDRITYAGGRIDNVGICLRDFHSLSRLAIERAGSGTVKSAGPSLARSCRYSCELERSIVSRGESES